MEVKTTKISRIKRRIKRIPENIKHDAIVVGGTLLAAAAVAVAYTRISNAHDADVEMLESTNWDADLAELMAIEAADTQM